VLINSFGPVSNKENKEIFIRTSIFNGNQKATIPKKNIPFLWETERAEPTPNDGPKSIYEWKTRTVFKGYQHHREGILLFQAFTSKEKTNEEEVSEIWTIFYLRFRMQRKRFGKCCIGLLYQYSWSNILRNTLRKYR
jgi:hypothetical protein